MRICYIDESGHCGTKYNADQPIEVLCGIMTDISKLFKTQKEHNDILDILKDHGVEVPELKGADIYRGRKEWHDIDPKERDAVYEILLEWSKERVCKFIVCPIDSNEFFKSKDNGCPIATKFGYPWEAAAFNVALAVQRENRSKKNNKGRTIVIFDEQEKHDERFLQLLEGDLSFTDGYTKYKKRPRAKSDPRLNQIVDIPHFSKSHMAVLIQLADIAAYIVNRHILISEYGFKEEYSGEADKFSKWYRIISANCIAHTSVDPPGQDDLCSFYRKMRPRKWTAKGFTKA